MEILFAICFIVSLVVGWLAQLVNLPGNWLIVSSSALYAWLGPEGRLGISWQIAVALFVLAVVGELIELAAAAMGVKRVGGSRRGAVMALVGSLVGGFVGLFVGLPIPVVGSLAAAVLFGGLGALIGAFLGESSKGRDFDTSLEIGKAAFVGRVLGIMAKIIVSSLMVAVALVGIVL